MFRKATANDIDAVAEIYAHIHEQEALGNTTTGWLADIYPVEATARTAVGRGDLYVYEGEGGKIEASAIINRTQVDSYAAGHWRYPARDDEVMVLHTLVVEPSAGGRGLGPAFVGFYEQYAREARCPYLRIDTNARNARARAMYAKLGFKEIDIVPCVFNGIPNVNLVLLEKKIDL